jgi:transposase-like protein
MNKKKTYSDEFKQESIWLQESSGKSIVAIERELGLSHNLLRQWKQRFQVNPTSNCLELSDLE